jgi:hypothetical protein
MPRRPRSRGRPSASDTIAGFEDARFTTASSFALLEALIRLGVAG